MRCTIRTTRDLIAVDESDTLVSGVFVVFRIDEGRRQTARLVSVGVDVGQLLKEMMT